MSDIVKVVALLCGTVVLLTLVLGACGVDFDGEPRPVYEGDVRLENTPNRDIDWESIFGEDQ